jgi:hypothetical protein
VSSFFLILGLFLDFGCWLHNFGLMHYVVSEIRRLGKES